MARRHGWQLPLHSFQVVAITIFFLLSAAYYTFFAPFLGKDIYEYIATAVYSVLVLSVFILYLRSTAIDPADPGIFREADETCPHSSDKDTDVPAGEVKLKDKGIPDRHGSNWCSKLGGLFCGPFVKQDCRKDDILQQTPEVEALFCRLCNAEVRKFSKHCRSCNKCVDGFDHHCRWLNNCIGRKNYVTFVSLMAVSLIWLIVELSVGIFVLVRCFLYRKGMEHQIAEKLGVGFSRPPFVTIVAICTTLSLLATVPLGELFFFHMILIRKGITTYEYVVAMRTQSEPPGPSENGGDQQSPPSSPTSSAVTAISGRSSIGMSLHYKGAWCTPPRIFTDHQDEIIPHLDPGRPPSTVDPDTMQADKGRRSSQRPVRISAWKLAKMDSNEAIKAAAKARVSSSVLRPVNSRHHSYDTDHLSNSYVSGRSSPVSIDQGVVNRNFGAETSRMSASYPASTASHASREDIEACRQSLSNFSTPNISNLIVSPLQHHPSNRDHFNPIYQPSAHQSPSSANGNTLEGNVTQIRTPRNVESLRTSVYWDQEAGRFMSSSSSSRGTPTSSQVQRTELFYAGQSIFFGGPLLNEQVSRETGGGSSMASGLNRGYLTGHYRLGRSRRDGQLPVFVPSDSQQNHFSYRSPQREQ
ncbi:hypothetical protein K2173_007447 [Erythroxylum novogranatense]|uniref:S-acyltransferase n=1 Tax=Erythroxylum novogranatense TaxID=1862640 RepID=A0AAV8T7R0_9ROSI|nr:hypothetical protein K2173_007447 [Erythroxylum novogranatense]